MQCLCCGGIQEPRQFLQHKTLLRAQLIPKRQEMTLVLITSDVGFLFLVYLLFSDKPKKFTPRDVISDKEDMTISLEGAPEFYQKRVVSRIEDIFFVVNMFYLLFGSKFLFVDSLNSVPCLIYCILCQIHLGKMTSANEFCDLELTKMVFYSITA